MLLYHQHCRVPVRTYTYTVPTPTLLNLQMVARHAEIALLAAQEVGGLDALLHSVEPAAINPNAAGAASPAALRKAKAAKAAKASTPWWLEESALTAAHLLTSTQLDAAIRSGATKTLQRERLTTVEHTAAVPAVARDASAGVVKVGTGGFTLCKHQAHALEMVPPLGQVNICIYIYVIGAPLYPTPPFLKLCQPLLYLYNCAHMHKSDCNGTLY